MRLFNSKKKKLAAASVMAVAIIGAGAVAANAAGGTGCKYLTYPLCARSVASLQVVDGSLIENDLHPSVKAKLNKVGTGEQGPAGPQGPKGDTGAQGAAGQDGTNGAQGAQGAQGAAGQDGTNGTNGTNGKDGVSGYEVVAKEVALPAGGADAAPVAVTASCPEGKVALGGGYKVDSPASNVQVFHSMGAGLTKTEAGTWISTGWDLKVQNPGGKTNITAFVTCAAIGK